MRLSYLAGRASARWLALLGAICLVCTLGAGPARAQPPACPPGQEEPCPVPEFQSFFDVPKHLSWHRHAPEVDGVTIISTADGSPQPALFYNSGSDRDKPLLVGLHSWSLSYVQKQSIAFALWARRNDWVLVLPDFRGINNKPETTVSDLAVQDIVDAVAYARTHARVDARRVYVAGFSGGGLATLAVLGRHPEFFTAGVAWVPIYDLVDWYEYVRTRDAHYKRNIEQSCGGVPRPGSDAFAECRRRSPISYLPNASGDWPKLLLAHGIADTTVPPSHSLRAFNALADDDDRIPADAIRAIDATGNLPPEIAGEGLHNQENHAYRALYAQADKPLRFARTSRNVSVELFQGGHDIIFNAGLTWLTRQVRDEPARLPQ